jgi:hypothetical protein
VKTVETVWVYLVGREDPIRVSRIKRNRYTTDNRWVVTDYKDDLFSFHRDQIQAVETVYEKEVPAANSVVWSDTLETLIREFPTSRYADILGEVERIAGPYARRLVAGDDEVGYGSTKLDRDAIYRILNP